ncbi:MAG TPA: M3 family oligoendopeptidase, partial [Vicinamibacteria bacterium]|nr:M3 family oligoendopeptidase [Vicinamibacteria bacterium]
MPTRLIPGLPWPRASRLRPFFAAPAALLFLSPAVGAQEPQGEVDENLFFEDREQIPLEYRWDLDAIFPGREAWEAARKEVEEALPGLGSYRGRLGESAEVLAAALRAKFEIERRFEDVFVYAFQLFYADTEDATAKELSGLAQALSAKVQEAASFIEPEIAQLPSDRLTESLKVDGVLPYAHYVDNIVRTKAHIRTAEIEEILAGASLPGAAYQQAFTTLENSDIEWPVIHGEDGKEQKVVPGQYIRFVTSQDRRVRREASMALFNVYDQFANTFASTLGGSIQRDAWLARTRRYDSSLDMALDATNVPRTVVDTLVETVHDNIEQIHNYAKLRKRLLGVDELHIYDTYVSLLPGLDRRYTFEEGWELAMEFWRETFGEEYAEVAMRARQHRWVDVYTSQGKQPGAFAWGTYDSHPYLLLNWNGNLDAVSTLVHEMGHAIHRHLTDEAQPFQYSSYSLFVAEVASVASESLFLEWFFKRSQDPVERKLLLNEAMNGITGTFVRQIFFHEWEAAAHAMAERGEPLTKESLGKVYRDLWQTYYGPDL